MIPILTYYWVDPDAGLVYGTRGVPIGSLDSSGYLQIDARNRGLGMISAHRLIWEAVNGPIPDGHEINHGDGVKTNNRITNLELVTHAENIQHAYRTGLKTNRGEKHPSRRLNNAAVREIRRDRAAGVSALELAGRFGVTDKSIYNVLRRLTWSHVGD